MSTLNPNNDISTTIKKLSKKTFQKLTNLTSTLSIIKKCYPQFIFKFLKKFYCQTTMNSSSSNMTKIYRWKNNLQTSRYSSPDSRPYFKLTKINNWKKRNIIISRDFEGVQLCKFCKYCDNLSKENFHVPRVSEIKLDLENLQVRCIRVMKFLQDHGKFDYINEKFDYIETKFTEDFHQPKTSSDSAISDYFFNKEIINNNVTKNMRIKRKKRSSKKYKLKMSKSREFSQDKSKNKLNEDKNKSTSFDGEDSGILEDMKSQVDEQIPDHHHHHHHPDPDDRIKKKSSDLKLNSIESDDSSTKSLKEAIKKITDDLVLFEKRAKARTRSKKLIKSSSNDKYQEIIQLLLRETDTEWSNDDDNSEKNRAISG